MTKFLSGFRRRVLIEPFQNRVAAELEDDWHRMVVVLSHRDGIVQSVEADMKRWPWSTCRGAIEVARSTFTGQPIGNVARSALRASHCTHLYDLALFAAAHAEDAGPTAYDVSVTDPVGEIRQAVVLRNGETVHSWILRGTFILEPDDLAGNALGDLGAWLNSLDKIGQEAARILRWATMMAQGRSMEIPTGLAASAFPPRACYTFQPEVARFSRRNANAHADFSENDPGPMEDRTGMFGAAPL